MTDPLSPSVNGAELPASACRELDELGFTIIRGPVPAGELSQLADAYDAAVESAAPEDVRIGSSTTRISDFVNRAPEFDRLYLHPPVLAACCRTIRQRFRLSAMHARTLRPGFPAQDLHVDFERDNQGWTMVGFIFMVDEFREDNGATRFLPRSHLWTDTPSELRRDPKAEDPRQVLACGPAGSIIVYNGAVWHGHSANWSDNPRRSIQGAYIRHGAQSGIDLPARMRPETLARISPLAKYVIAVEPS